RPAHRTILGSILVTIGMATTACGGSGSTSTALGTPLPDGGSGAIAEGMQTFRYDTFGDEAFWGGTLRLHEAIQGSTADGGVGTGVSAKAALAVGLKVDSEAVPPATLAAIKSGQVDLDDPANTLALLKANAVVGVTGFFNDDGTLKTLGIQCAFCHSTVDDSV